MDEDVKAVAEIAFDAVARTMALEVLVTRLLASQARYFPESVAAVLIDNPTGIVEDVTRTLPEGMTTMAPLIEEYLRGYLDQAGRHLDAAK